MNGQPSKGYQLLREQRIQRDARREGLTVESYARNMDLLRHGKPVEPGFNRFLLARYN